MLNVNIPKPCHEDWSKMTPTQKGAFCGKCQLEVIDFTNLSNNEIKNTLFEACGKRVCGHIKPQQLTELNSDFTRWRNQSVKQFKAKFLWACVLVFGMTLFAGCSDDVYQPDVVGVMECHDNTHETNTLTGDTIYNAPIALGKMEITDEPASTCADSNQDCNLTTPIKGQMIDGEIEISEDYYDSLEHERN